MAKVDKAALAAKNAEGARKARELRKQHEEERRAEGKTPGATIESKPAGGNSKTALAELRRKEVAKQAEANAKELAKVEKSLVSVAKEVNVRLEKANKLMADADDHRLAAALRLAEAKQKVEEAGGSFKAWAEANITEQSYENVRKLAYVGGQDDPKQALADLRTRTKKAVEAHREKAKVAKQEAKQLAGPAKSPFTVAEESIAKLDEKATVNLIESRAKKLGMKVISEGEFKALKKAASEAPIRGHDLQSAKEVFGDLKAADKMTFLRWAAAEIGASIDTAAFEQAVAEPADGSPPAFMRRKPSRRAPAAEASASSAA